MRKRFKIQYEIGIDPIEEVKIPTNSRDELPPVMAALQTIFKTPELNEKVFGLIEPCILRDKEATGREGMSMWEILVLACVRMALDTNYDQLHTQANYNKLIRAIMGVEHAWEEGKTYSLQTIKDNVRLLDVSTINAVNELVVQTAHQFALKKNETLRIKSDTYVLETNVHFPTDLNLLWDSCRKSLEIMVSIQKAHGITGWRKQKFWFSSLKSLLRSCGKACQSRAKNKEEQIKTQVEGYLRLAGELNKKLNVSLDELYECVEIDKIPWPQIRELFYYQGMLIKHIDLVERRLLKGEKIPASEKVYSIFETYTEWISKGKINKKVELGRKVVIATDQYHFILHHEIVKNKKDSAFTIDLADKLLSKYDRIESLSLDKGFYSKENKELLTLEIHKVIMPKLGKLTLEQKQEESAKEFKKLKYKHSAVESNINQLEHNGLNQCPDKGFENFERYTALGVLSYNLHRLGSLLLKERRKTVKKAA